MFPSERQGNIDMYTINNSENYTNYVFSTNSSRTLPCYNATSIRDYSHCCVQHRTPARIYREPIMYRRPDKLIAKRKRRPAFTTQQILALEKIFNKKPRVNRQERKVLMERLSLSDRVIKLWFKNRRRLSGSRREPTVISDSSGEESEHSFNLDYVQSKINKPDKFGYVTLDDRAMKELMTVVNSLLSDIDVDEICMELKNKTSDVLNYEPVSPVSSHDDADENICLSKWEIYEPEESLRRLFDVQALITK